MNHSPFSAETKPSAGTRVATKVTINYAELENTQSNSPPLARILSVTAWQKALDQAGPEMCQAEEKVSGTGFIKSKGLGIG